MRKEPVIGVIGGTGLYEIDGLERIERITVDTPFGAPSDSYIVGTLAGRRMVFLPRHGSAHRVLPHEINFRANLWGMKKLGVSEIVSVSAVGSMREEIAPGHIVLVDQFIDRTRARASTFYGDGLVVHVGFADPVCPMVREHLLESARTLDIVAHDGGTYVCIDGPQFSTRAESLLFRSWGVHVIGMTNLPEARLAREAEICYATIALATDYDCWHAEEEEVSVGGVLAVLKTNAEKAKRLIKAYAERAVEDLECPLCPVAVRTGMVTARDRIPPSVREALDPILTPILEASS